MHEGNRHLAATPRPFAAARRGGPRAPGAGLAATLAVALALWGLVLTGVVAPLGAWLAAPLPAAAPAARPPGEQVVCACPPMAPRRAAP